MKNQLGWLGCRSVVMFACALVLAIVSVGAPAAQAQATSGDIVGTVTDKLGAAIPNASITAKNTETGVITQTKANAVGDFHVPNLLAGKYDITASATGFASFTLKGFDVSLNNTSTAKITLPVASSTSVVEVSADATAVIDTTTIQLQTSFETEELKNFPTASVGNGVLNLSLLVPGVASSGAVGAGTGPSVGGQRPRADNYQIEGIDNNNKSVTGPLVYVPNDAVGEFTVVTNQFSPEFGHSAGGQFNSTVASGTNKIHGTAYEYFQNRNLNAENAIAGGKVPNPRYDFNRYGGQFGGPIKKDRLFYFGNYERQTTGQSSSYYLCTPTAAGMTALGTVPNLNSTNLGIFSKYTLVSPSQVDAANDNACFNQSTGPQTLTVYDGTNYNASSGEFGSGTAYDIPLGNYNVQAPSYSNFSALTTSVDYKISEKDSFRGRYIYNKFTGIDTAAALPAFYQPLPQSFHLIALSEFHNFTPNLINEARLGYNRFSNITPSGNYTFPGLDSFPTMYMYDSGFLEIGPDGNAPQSTIQNLYQFTNNISWIKGKHNLKFGFDGRKYISPQSFTQRVRGDYEYNFLTEYLHDLAPTAFGERSTGDFFYYGDQTAFYGYANDVWRITEKLSLNYGLRYEFTSVPVGQRTQVLNEAASVPGLIVFSKPKPQYTNILPRVGVNYALNPETSFRVGYGMATDVLYDNLGILSFPPQYSSTNDVGSGTNPNPGDPNFLTNGGLPAGNGSLATFDTIADQRAATSAYVPDQKLPYAETWTLGVQHVFAKDYTAEIRYVGTRGLHLPTQNQYNVQPRADADHSLPTYIGQTPSSAELEGLPNTLATIKARSNISPDFLAAGFTSKITSFQPWSDSNYNGMAVSLNRRFSHGFLLDLAYTWSKTMDDATADVFSTVLTPRRPQNSRDVKADYSRSALDRTHRLTLAAVYDLPYFKSSGWLMKNVVGNWEVAPIYTYESPEYYTVLSGVNSNLNGDSTAIDRTIYNKNGKAGTGSAVTAIYDPSRASLCAAPATTCNANLVAYQAVDPTARYITAQAGSLPTGQRNTQPINPINNLDATAVKRFNFAERYAMEFSAGAFNVLNHAQYIPGTVDNINSPGYTSQILFQTASNPGFNQANKFFTANARSMQLALKFTF
jgi:Carboxypeptidase regulatory-like domain